MNVLYRLLLTFNATSLIVVIFLVKQDIILNIYIYESSTISRYLSFVIYPSIPILLTFISLIISRRLGHSNLARGTIIEVEQANNAFLPSYLGYFFVALSVPNCNTLVFVFAILFVFTFLSQTLYFNPLFLFFGYHFYYIKTENKVKLFIISKKIINKPDEVGFRNLRRINNFTFIDLESDELSDSKEEKN